ncbi:MAG TPA: GtrA family protein [Rhizomicrobium sp.]|jgi:putative flippase GtrA|nr:GtrA family protein [Rhizomicrobium sp.]
MNLLAARVKRLHEIRFLRFALVGTGGFLVNWMALYLALHLAGLDKYSGWFAAFLIAVTFTWWGNRMLTFRDRAATRGLAREWFAFLVGNSLGAAANFTVYFLLVTFARAPLGDPLVAIVAGTLVGLIFNFTVSARFVFRQKI